MNFLTEEELTALEKLERRAFSGEWTAQGYEVVTPCDHCEDGSMTVVNYDEDAFPGLDSYGTTEFIAAIRNAASDLIAQARAASLYRERLEHLRFMLQGNPALETLMDIVLEALAGKDEA